jgi:hypothetical protein
VKSILIALTLALSLAVPGSVYACPS